jgi:hypothetical protein
MGTAVPRTSVPPNPDPQFRASLSREEAVAGDDGDVLRLEDQTQTAAELRRL